MTVVHAGALSASDRHRRIFAATLEILIEVGFDRLTMDAVAARAHSSKATLYRHWPSKAELVTDAVQSLHSAYTVEAPSTDSLRLDLLEFFSHLHDQGAQDQVCMMRGLVSACSTDQSLAPSTLLNLSSGSTVVSCIGPVELLRGPSRARPHRDHARRRAPTYTRRGTT